MQEPIVTRLPKSQIKIDFVVLPEEVKPYLDAAVTDISNTKPIKGFRPGKATYEDVKRAYGEMQIWESALERIVRAMYVKTILDQGIETVGSPSIEVGKLVPGQAIEFSVTANVLPNAVSVADYSMPQVEEKPHTVTDAEINTALDNLRKMRRNEIVVDRAATMDDLVVVDLSIKKNSVPIEGGASVDYRIYLNEPNYIPGLAEKIVGAKKGNALEFVLTFPTEHYNTQLAGQPLEFTVNIKDVYALQIPPADDAFAKMIGMESLNALKDLLQKNLQAEADQKSNEAAEIELLEKLVKNSRFSEIPDLIVTEEIRRMIGELEQSLVHQGGNLKDYLTSIKKTMDDLRIDFVPRALQRIQTAVLLKEIGMREKLSVNDTEIDDEIDRILASLKSEDTEARKNVSSPEYREYVAVQMKNRRVVQLLKDKGVKKDLGS